MEPIIHVQHLTKRYKKSATPAVDNIRFDVGEGELFAFLGPNGAGKTTTISILTTTLAKTSVVVRIEIVVVFRPRSARGRRTAHPARVEADVVDGGRGALLVALGQVLDADNGVHGMSLSGVS